MALWLTKCGWCETFPTPTLNLKDAIQVFPHFPNTWNLINKKKQPKQVLEKVCKTCFVTLTGVFFCGFGLTGLSSRGLYWPFIFNIWTKYPTGHLTKQAPTLRLLRAYFINLLIRIHVKRTIIEKRNLWAALLRTTLLLYLCAFNVKSFSVGDWTARIVTGMLNIHHHAGSVMHEDKWRIRGYQHNGAVIKVPTTQVGSMERDNCIDFLHAVKLIKLGG